MNKREKVGEGSNRGCTYTKTARYRSTISERETDFYTPKISSARQTHLFLQVSVLVFEVIPKVFGNKFFNSVHMCTRRLQREQRPLLEVRFGAVLFCFFCAFFCLGVRNVIRDNCKRSVQFLLDSQECRSCRTCADGFKHGILHLDRRVFLQRNKDHECRLHHQLPFMTEKVDRDAQPTGCRELQLGPA